MRADAAEQDDVVAGTLADGRGRGVGDGGVGDRLDRDGGEGALEVGFGVVRGGDDFGDVGEEAGEQGAVIIDGEAGEA